MAELILTNGKVITLDGRGRIASAIALDGGRISAVGTDEDVLSHAGEATRRLDLAGRAVVPGLIDGHAHMDREGLKRRLPSLSGARSIADIQARIAALAAKTPPGEWIVTMPIGEPPEYLDVPDNLAEGRVPNRWELDEAAPDNPVYIRAIWGHWRNTLPLISIANSRALAAAQVDRDSEPPAPSIEIQKDADGEPTGVFIEQVYKPLVEHTLMAAAPRFSFEDRVAGLRRSMAIYNAYGTTSIFEGHGIAGEVLCVYQALREQGALPVRSHLMFSPAWSTNDIADVRRLVQSWGRWLRGRGMGDDYLRMSGIYTESDDTEENRLRARTSPYTGWAGFNYDACLPEDLMVEMMVEAARADIRIGSFTPNILDLYEKVNRLVPISEKRWIIEHIGVYSDDEIKRIRDLGLVLTAYTNRYVYQDGAMLAEQLGPDSARRIAPLRSLREAGVHVSLATDNVPPTMFHPVWHAVAREAKATGAVIEPDECLTPEEALAGAAIEGAYLTFDEAEKGTIETGKLADLVVLNTDPLTCETRELKDIVAEVTVVGGKIVYDRARDGDPTSYNS